MPELGPHDVHLWLTFHDRIGAGLDALRPLLDEVELARAARYHAPDDRQRHLVTRALVRTTLSRYADVAPADWRFGANAHGRPEIAKATGEAAGLRFNLSHTRGLIALAVSRRRELGVDVECVSARQVSPRLAQRFFSPREAAALARLEGATAEQRQRRLLEYWTFKEAYVKARGHGLGFPLERFSVGLDEGQPVRLELDAALEDDPRRWHLAQYRPGPDHLLALCAERIAHDTPRITLYEVTPPGEPAPCGVPLWRSSAAAP